MTADWVHNTVDRAEAKAKAVYHRAGAKVHDVFEYTYHKAHAIAGVCDSPTLGQVKDLMEHAASLTGKAKSATAFANSVNALGDAGDKLNGAVTKIDDLIKSGKRVAGDAKAACEISDAVAILNKWAVPGSRTSSEDAAKAFDQLFGGAANFMAKLPFPASLYGDIFADIAKNSFFSNMRDLMDPESPNTPRGRMMRQVENLPELHGQ